MSDLLAICGYCAGPFEPSTHHAAKNEFCSENCRKRSWDESHRPRCVCGTSISQRSKRCWDCEMARREANSAHRAVIKELWDQGLPVKAIIRDPRVRRTTVGSLGVEMERMKKAGWELAPRRAGWKGHSSNPGANPILKPVYSSREAAQRVGHAVRSGSLIRAAKCERCGATGRVEAHHHDYSKPLDVEWLCRTCHAAHHADQRRIHPKVAA